MYRRLDMPSADEDISAVATEQGGGRDIDRAIDRECILTLYKQVPNSVAAAAVVTAYMVITAWTWSPHPVILAWLGVQLLSQAARLGLYAAYRRVQPRGDALRGWATAYTGYMLVAGVIWGTSLFLFAAPTQPLTVCLTLCGLYGVSAGSVPGNAYNPPGCYAFILTIFAIAMARMIQFGDFGHVVLGVASLMFALIMAMFTRVQNRVVREGFAIRFENVRIMAEMQVARERAETARRQAESASLAKSQFLAAASHDLRQPLYALSLFSGALQSFALADDAAEVVTRIQDNIAAMEGLFNGLLDLSRLDAGAVKSVHAAFALQPLFDRLERIAAPQARDKGLRLRLRPTDLWVEGDAVLVEQILVNLIANAVRYTASGGVVIGARRRDGQVVIQVSDSGQGIASADQARIFEEFVQIGNAERDRRKGMGLGLAIAARTAALLGTRIELWSQPGRGSRFGFALAQARTDVASAAVLMMPLNGAPAMPRLGGPRLLVIDDDRIVREALAMLLESWGVEATLVDGVAAAQAAIDRALADKAPYQVILCDHRLGEGRGGLDFLIGLKALDPRPGMALVTGDVDADLLRRVANADIFLVHKPVDPARLRALLNHLASLSQASVA